MKSSWWQPPCLVWKKYNWWSLNQHWTIAFIKIKEHHRWVINATVVVVQREPEKNSGLREILTLEFYDAGAPRTSCADMPTTGHVLLKAWSVRHFQYMIFIYSILLLWPSCLHSHEESITGSGCKREENFFTARLHLEGQPLTLSYTIFDSQKRYRFDIPSTDK